MTSACTATLDLDELTAGRGPDAGRIDDAGPIDASVAEPGEEMLTPTAGSARDAGAPAPSFCVTLQDPVHCEDFDVRPAPGRWAIVQRPDATARGEVRFEPRAEGVSGRSMLVSVREDPRADGEQAATIGKDFDVTRERESYLRLKFDVRVEQYDRRPGRKLGIAQVRLGTPEVETVVRLALVSRGDALDLTLTEAALGTGATPMEHEHVAVPLFGRPEWVHVGLHVWLLDDRKLLVLYLQQPGQGQGLDNPHATMHLDAPLRFALPRRVRSRIELGAPWIDTREGTASWRVRYDDLIAEPAAVSRWDCLREGKKVSAVDIWWQPSAGNGAYACNSWRGECSGNACTAVASEPPSVP